MRMSFLCSKEFNVSLSMQWVQESVNTIGQHGFMCSCILLYQNNKATNFGPQQETEG